MLRIIEDLAGDWRRLDAYRGAVERDRNAGPSRSGLRAIDDGARHWPAHLERHGGRDRHWRCILERPRLRRLAWTGAEADIDRRPHNPRQDNQGAAIAICARCSCKPRGSCWSGSSAGSVMASNLGSKPPRNDCTTTCWRLRSPISAPGSPGRFSTRDAPSRASTRRRRRPDLLDPRAVLGAVKARPGSGGARRQGSTTAGLDGPLRGASARAGQDEGTTARHERRNSAKRGAIDDVTSLPYPPRSARG